MLMHELVLAPVGMTHSTYEQPLPSLYWNNTSSGHRSGGRPLAGGWHTMPEMAAAGLWTTATDLAQFSIDLQLALAGQANHILSPEMVRIFLSPEVQRDDSGFMGLGVWLEGSGPTGRFGHPGDNEGFACRWTALREDGKGVVIMTSSDTGGQLIDEVLRAVVQAYDWPEVENLPPPAPLLDTLMMRYVGTYQFRSGIVCTITQKHDTLYLQSSHQPAVPLTAKSKTVYILQPVDGEIIFLVNDEGIVLGLRLRQDGSELGADKVS
jgi:hypothetical protein